MNFNFYEVEERRYKDPDAAAETVYNLLFDDTTRIVHIMDCNIRGTHSLINAMSFRFIDHIFTYDLWTSAKTSSRFFLYGSDGMIVEWSLGSFLALSEDDNKKVYEPYRKVISRF